VEYRLHYAPDGFPGPLAFAPQPDAFYRNRGDGTFEDATAASGIDRIAPGRAMGVAVLDADGDGHPDLYVANDASANFLFLNDGKGAFREAGVASGTAFGFHGEATSSMAGAVGDVDGDRRPDLLVTDGAFGSLYRTSAGGSSRTASTVGAQHASACPLGRRSPVTDGAVDVWRPAPASTATGRPDLLLRNRGDTPRTCRHRQAVLRRETVSRAALALDVDDDGRSTSSSRASARPRAPAQRGCPAARRHDRARRRATRHDAVGARMSSGQRPPDQRVHQLATGYLGQHDPREHFGLGAATKVDRLEVTWADGTVTTRTDLAADRVWRIEQGAPSR
jgi:hypothetical protein